MKAKSLLAIVLSVAVIFATPAFAGSNEVDVRWADVPVVAQKTIQKTIDDHAEVGIVGMIEGIKKKTKISGGKNVIVYEADVRTPDGKMVEIDVREDGRLMKFERD